MHDATKQQCSPNVKLRTNSSPDTSQTYGEIPDIRPRDVKFLNIPRFSRQVVRLQSTINIRKMVKHPTDDKQQHKLC